MAREMRRSAQVGIHELDRRDFLKGSATAIILAGVSPWLVGTTSAGGTLPTKAVFQGLVGQWFYVAGATSAPIQLVAVVDGPASSDADQFTLMFSAPGASLAEGTFTVTPPTGDAFDLFLQPQSGDGTTALTVRASFNLLQPAPVAPSCA
ncbi:MAG TPA: twin-arginine translocation signal domain-containing protein [Myxococcota bacterium]|nr:twin-arginine translocation signal domain-containing protein [Myxococcota bacterium]